MFRIISFLILFATSASAPTSSISPLPQIETPAESALDADKQTLVDWAHSRFSEAGLELPEIAMRFDPSREDCNGNDGLYRYSAGQHAVTICTRRSTSFEAELQNRRTLLHEFAHVWDTANLTEQDRAGMNAMFGTTAWRSGIDEWSERGSEWFAETFVFGLLDQPRRQLKIEAGCEDLVEWFGAVTGAGPLGPGLPWCVEA